MDISTVDEAPAASAEEALQRANQMICSAWPQIVGVSVGFAKEGSVPHTKLLHDIWTAPKEKVKAEATQKPAAKDETPPVDPTHQLLHLLIDTIAQLRQSDEETDRSYGPVN